MISSPSPGDIAIGTSGQRCEVLWVNGSHVAIAHPIGQKLIAINKVKHFERPAIRFEVGDRVGKIHNLGWWGYVASPQKIEKVEVLWDYDTYPTMEDIANIKLRHCPIPNTNC